MKRFAAVFALALLLPISAKAVTCPPQSSPQFSAGGNVFGFLAVQWNAFFAAKADANNGTLCNPTIVGVINLTFSQIVSALGYTPLNPANNLSDVQYPAATIPGNSGGSAASLAPLTAQQVLMLLGLGPQVSNNTSLQALSTTNFSWVIRRGVAAVGDAPPLPFKGSNAACSLNSGAGDGVWQVPSADGKCWLAIFPAEGVDLRQAAGAGDNSADNAAPLLNAIAAAVSSGASRVAIPGGKFKFLSRVNYTLPSGKYVSIVGAGSGATELTWPNAAGGLNIIYTDNTNYASFKGLMFTTGVAAGGDGLELQQTVTSNAGVTAFPVTYTEDLLFRGTDWPSPANNYWTRGLHTLGVSNINGYSISYVGPAGATHLGTGVLLNGGTSTRIAVVYTFDNLAVWNAQIGLDVGQYIQGVVGNKPNFTAVDYGVRCASTTGTAQLALTDIQALFNVAGVYSACDQTSVKGGLFYAGANNAAGVWLAGAPRPSVIGNVFEMVNGVTGTVGVEVDLLGNPLGGVIADNTFHAVNTGIWFSQPATDYGDYRTTGNNYDISDPNTSANVAFPVTVAGTAIVDWPIPFANVSPCASKHRGKIQAITDSNTTTWAATAAGGGSNYGLLNCNAASNWTLIGK